MFAKIACARPSFMLQQIKVPGKLAVFATRDETVSPLGMNGAPGRIRTHDPQIRSLVLYPAELPVLTGRRTYAGRLQLASVQTRA